jgi:iron complex transport system substrate-binding protein
VVGLALTGFILALPPSILRAATLVDSANRSATVADKVKAVVPAGPPAQVLIHALAPDRLAALVEPFRPEHVIYVDPTVRELPQIPMLNRTSAPGDVAMVTALKPDLVVDYGNASARYVAADEKIQKEIGVPAVLFAGGLAETGRVARSIGAAIGADARGATLAATADDVLRRAKPLTDLADADRVSVYLARGADGLTAARTGTSFDEPIRLAGGRNVVEGGNGTFKHMSVEEVVALQPAVVVLSDRDALSSPLHAALPKGTRFVLDTGEPYKVLTGPPSINRLVGLAALAAILHPDVFTMVPDDIARIETTLFPIPPGLAEPAPLEVSP